MAKLKISELVYIRRKKHINAFYNVNNKVFKDSERLEFLGGEMNSGGSVRRGLDSDEERVLLKSILGIDERSLDWENATRTYWSNIRVLIPSSGLELEIGFEYDNEENMKNASYEPIENRWKYGTPLNLSDYLLYRYALVSNRVANSPADINKSNKIRFYIYTRAAEIKEKHTKYTIIKRANEVLTTLLGDRLKAKNVVLLYQAPEMTNDNEIDVFLYEKSQQEPEAFISIVNDPDLDMRCLIQKAIRIGILRKQPNTTIILASDTDILGENESEAVAALKTEKRANLLQRIKSTLKIEPVSLSKEVVGGVKIINEIPVSKVATPKVGGTLPIPVATKSPTSTKESSDNTNQYQKEPVSTKG